MVLKGRECCPSQTNSIALYKAAVPSVSCNFGAIFDTFNKITFNLGILKVVQVSDKLFVDVKINAF